MISYERGLSHSYVIFTDDNKNADALTISMLRENEIEGLLPLKVSVNNSIAEVAYEISGYQSMKKLLESSRINHERIMILLEAMHSLSESLEAYYLEPDCLVLNPENIYWDKDFSKALFCYDITGEASGKAYLMDLSELILEAADYNDYKSTVYAYELRQAIKTDNFSLGSIIDKLKEVGVFPVYNTTPEPAIVADNTVHFSSEVKEDTILTASASEVTKEEPETYSKTSIMQEMAQLLDEEDDWEKEEPSGKLFSFTKKKKPKKEKAKKQECSDDIGLMEESFFHVGKVESPGEHRVYESKKYEISSVNNISESLVMENYPFLVGSLQYAVDGCIDAPDISRFHARFDQNMGKVYLSDLNSATGTFLNGERLKGSVQREIKAGDKIKFGNLDFVVT